MATAKNPKSAQKKTTAKKGLAFQFCSVTLGDLTEEQKQKHLDSWCSSLVDGLSNAARLGVPFDQRDRRCGGEKLLKEAQAARGAFERACNELASSPLLEPALTALRACEREIDGRIGMYEHVGRKWDEKTWSFLEERGHSRPTHRRRNPMLLYLVDMLCSLGFDKNRARDRVQAYAGTLTPNPFAQISGFRQVWQQYWAVAEKALADRAEVRRDCRNRRESKRKD